MVDLGDQAAAHQRGAASEATVKAWCLYNWADHGWATPVATVLIGPWMLALADNAVGKHGTLIALGALRLRADAFPSAMITLAALVQVVALPLLGARADAGDAKRAWLAAACTVGSVICGLLALTGGSEWLLAGLLFLAGSLVEGISDIAWNGMLPQLGEHARHDAISARGTAVGYLGAGILLIVELAVIDVHGTLGVTKTTAVRGCFVIAGLWWAIFGWRALHRLDLARRALPPTRLGALATLRHGLRLLRARPQARRYTIAYLCFADATSAVISLSSTFLSHQLFHDDATKATPFLFELILVIQFVALLGAVGFGRLARRWGTKQALVVALVLWVGVIVFAYAVLTDRLDAVIAGIWIGIALGGTTALARSMFSRMIPAGMEATWFGIYEICSQGTAWMAPLLFTIVVDATGSFRQAILSLIVLFALGLGVLASVDPEEAAAEVARGGAG